MILENLSSLKENIQAICHRLGRNPDEIVIVGVTKYADITQIKDAINAGLSDIGENYVKPALEKFTVLGDQLTGLRKHYIGHLQTNKVKLAVEAFDCIQSVDSIKLACEISKQAVKMNKTIDVLVEVNCSQEQQKYGIAVDQALPLIKEMIPLSNLRILGLMTMAPFIGDEMQIRSCFSKLRQLKERIEKQCADVEHCSMKYLSMGMTNDYAIALEEGSNMLRIGTAIFGS